MQLDAAVCRPRAIPCLCSPRPAIRRVVSASLRGITLLWPASGRCCCIDGVYATRLHSSIDREPGVRSRRAGFACEKRRRGAAISCPGDGGPFNLESNVGSGLVSQFPRGAALDLCRLHPMCLQLAVTAGESCNIDARARQTTHQRACATGRITLRQGWPKQRLTHAQYTLILSSRVLPVASAQPSAFSSRPLLAETSEALLAGTLARDRRLTPLVLSANSCLPSQSHCSGQLTPLRPSLSRLGLQTAPRGEDYYVFALALAHETWLPQASPLPFCRGGPFISLLLLLLLLLRPLRPRACSRARRVKSYRVAGDASNRSARDLKAHRKPNGALRHLLRAARRHHRSGLRFPDPPSPAVITSQRHDHCRRTNW